MSNAGFYKMQRGWMTHPLFARDKCWDSRSAWAYIIESACYRTSRYNCLGNVVEVDRGSFFTTRRELSNVWNWSERCVRTFLTRLEKEDMITLKTDQGKTQIYVMNYDTYQFPSQESDQGVTKHRPTKEINKRNKRNKTPAFFLEGLASHYPTRSARNDVLGAYRRLAPKVKKKQTTWEDFFVACERYKQECIKTNRIGTQYVKCPKTFANDVFLNYLGEEAQTVADHLDRKWTAE